ncbi:hypothetical protein BKA83DRAFT_4127437 [Pisolithus microcarpus]|nr:hypothetical protein BKA83DRAFT_4127437 [Pisolithus microcarpus]
MPKDNSCARCRVTRGDDEGECRENGGKETERIRALSDKIFAKLSECTLVHEIGNISAPVVAVEGTWDEMEKKELYRLAHPVSRYAPSRLIPLYTPRKPVSPQPLSVPQRERYHQVSSSSFTSEKSERFGAGVHELCVKWGRGWEDGIALAKNRWAESYETSGGDGGTRGELGERGNTENGAPNPELFQISSYKAFLQGTGHISGCTEANATKNIPFERSRRVEHESQFARGMGEWRSRYCVDSVGDEADGGETPRTIYS